MKKGILVIIGLIAGFTSVSAQSNNNGLLTIGFEFGLPAGDFSNFYDSGTGVSLIYQSPVSERMFLTANLAYIRFSGKSQVGAVNLKYKKDFVPLKAGVKYYLFNNVYGSAELGAAIGSGTRSNGVAFAYSPGVGTELPFGNKSKIDLGLRYESWMKGGSSNFFGLRAALMFGL